MTSTWPPPTGLSTPTVPRSSATFQIASRTTINAPAALVLAILRDAPAYADWMTWIPRAIIHSQPPTSTSPSTLVVGTLFSFMVMMDASTPQKLTDTVLRVTDISTPDTPSTYVPKEMLESDGSFHPDLSQVYRIGWKSEGGFVAMGLRTERFHDIIVLGEATCEVRTWEVMGGFLARTVKWMYAANLAEKFEVWCKVLKTRAETLYAERET